MPNIPVVLPYLVMLVLVLDFNFSTLGLVYFDDIVEISEIHVWATTKSHLA